MAVVINRPPPGAIVVGILPNHHVPALEAAGMRRARRRCGAGRMRAHA
eukprot:gene3743-9433_t